jgi:hypothetical protein
MSPFGCQNKHIAAYLSSLQVDPSWFGSMLMRLKQQPLQQQNRKQQQQQQTSSCQMGSA